MRWNNLDPLLNWGKSRIENNQNCIIVINGSTGCQPMGSKVLMANGEWKNIEDIKKGDLVLSPQTNGNNTFSKVINTTKWYSNKNHDIYMLNRSKKYLYTCSHNHLIPLYVKVHPRKSGMRKKEWCYWRIKNYPVDELTKMSEKQRNHDKIGFSSFAINKFKDRMNCDIEPYTLGVFLGDGHYSHNTHIKINKDYMNMKRSDKKYFLKHTYGRLAIFSANLEIMGELSKYYPILNIHKQKNNLSKSYDFGINSELAKQLTKYKLVNKKSGKKFIPKEALYSDIEYRKRLLAGLIDTDGYYAKGRGGYQLTTKSKRLAKDILFLVYTLGGRGNINKIKKRIKKLNFEGEYYTVSFYLHKLKLPLKITKKVRDTKCSYLSSNRIAITTKKSKPSMVYGFQLDSSSGLYITDNFMVTHNSGKTYSGLDIAIQFAKLHGFNFTVKNNLDFTFEGLLEKMDLPENQGKGVPFVFEEVGVVGGGAASSEWQTKANSFFNSFVQTARHLNQILIFTCPNFHNLDKRTRELVHCQLITNGINHTNKLCSLNPYFLQVNPTTAKIYRKRMRFRTNGIKYKLTELKAKLPPKEIVTEYEKSKTTFTKELRRRILERKKPKKRGIIDPDTIDKQFEEGILDKELARRYNVSIRAIYKHKKRWRNELKSVPKDTEIPPIP
jgi:hypothetical protein